MKRFDADPTNISRARQIYLILIGRAMRQQTITYSQLGEALGYTSPNCGAGVMGDKLAPLYYWGQKENLPPLTSIVVDEQTGLPGEGFRIPNVPQLHQQVYAYDWYGIEMPTEEDLCEAVEARRSGQIQFPRGNAA